MLEVPPLFRPKFWLNRHGLHIVMPSGKLHIIPSRRLQIKPDEVISDVLMAVEQQVNVYDETYTMITDLRICYTKRDVEEIRRDNMVLHLHLAGYQEKRIVRTRWRSHRSRASSTGNYTAR